jgi:hypothetical protein
LLSVVTTCGPKVSIYKSACFLNGKLTWFESPSSKNSILIIFSTFKISQEFFHFALVQIKKYEKRQIAEPLSIPSLLRKVKREDKGLFPGESCDRIINHRRSKKTASQSVVEVLSVPEHFVQLS